MFYKLPAARVKPKLRFKKSKTNAKQGAKFAKKKENNQIQKLKKLAGRERKRERQSKDQQLGYTSNGRFLFFNGLTTPAEFIYPEIGKEHFLA